MSQHCLKNASVTLQCISGIPVSEARKVIIPLTFRNGQTVTGIHCSVQWTSF